MQEKTRKKILRVATALLAIILILLLILPIGASFYY